MLPLLPLACLRRAEILIRHAPTRVRTNGKQEQPLRLNDLLFDPQLQGQHLLDDLPLPGSPRCMYRCLLLEPRSVQISLAARDDGNRHHASFVPRLVVGALAKPSPRPE